MMAKPAHKVWSPVGDNRPEEWRAGRRDQFDIPLARGLPPVEFDDALVWNSPSRQVRADAKRHDKTRLCQDLMATMLA